MLLALAGGGAPRAGGDWYYEKVLDRLPRLLRLAPESDSRSHENWLKDVFNVRATQIRGHVDKTGIYIYFSQSQESSDVVFKMVKPFLLGVIMNATLIYDGTTLDFSILGSPLPDQLDGTPLENLGELASRICYDSLGTDYSGVRRGRPGKALHKHILEVDNTSVYEHCVFTVRFEKVDTVAVALACVNRKGIWLERIDAWTIDLTINFRAILKWDSVAPQFYGSTLKNILLHFGNVLAPTIFPEKVSLPFNSKVYLKKEDLSANQAHVTLWLSGSRGFTHEQVRHRFAMSQRSTRYVDESESAYVQHPLVTKFLEDGATDVRRLIIRSEEADKEAYRFLVRDLTVYCKNNGMDATSARKQARGAARGYLGNALSSEMLFTCSCADWLWILKNRKSKPADAEIREVYTFGLTALKSCVHGHFFSHLTTGPSPDGLGTILLDS